MLIEDFNQTIDLWINSILRYSFEQLCMLPGANSWSLGQVCMHLINDTNWFIQQINICTFNNDNKSETMSAFAQTMFTNNAFPNQKLSNPANISVPQPESKKTLVRLFIKLKKDMSEAAKQIVFTKPKGKTKHPGFNYFNAEEWLQFAVMHLRHHLKQKKRIEDFLKYKSL